MHAVSEEVDKKNPEIWGRTRIERNEKNIGSEIKAQNSLAEGE